MMEDWRSFVVEHGTALRPAYMAAVVGQPVDAIERLHRTGAVRRRRSGEPRISFSDAFALWHGRPPADDEWPKPTYYTKDNRYEWLPPELALLASLVGTMGTDELADLLTKRLRKVTGNPKAQRSLFAVQSRIQLLGLQTSEVLGGISLTAAGKEINSYQIVHAAVERGEIRSRWVGRQIVLDRESWDEWKTSRTFPPKGYVQLSSIREALGIRSDKTSEFARMGYIPTAIRCNPFGTRMKSTQFGTWFIDPRVAKKLVADRRRGLPMPWHGKPLADNLKVVWKRWCERKHPASCTTCQGIWGAAGAPQSFDAFVAQYHPLEHGAKRHLTMKWTPGLRFAEAARLAKCSVDHVKRAVANGQLQAVTHGRTRYLTQSDVTRWIARDAPTGDAKKSWIALSTASKQFGFSPEELRAHITEKRLVTKIGTFGAAHGIQYVSRHQCSALREAVGFTEEEAARKVGVSIKRLRELLKGVDWREAERIPLLTVQATIKRLQSHHGYSLKEAATELGVTVARVKTEVAAGTVRVKRADWHGTRIYLTRPMLERLRAALKAPTRDEKLSPDWLHQSEAALLAGVSGATLVRWYEEGSLPRQKSSTGWRYHRSDVKRRARLYWKNVRFKRATPPAWIANDGRRLRHRP
jgi:excisionase family DNA binding protein